MTKRSPTSYCHWHLLLQDSHLAANAGSFQVHVEGVIVYLDLCTPCHRALRSWLKLLGFARTALQPATPPPTAATLHELIPTGRY
jgi:hypothetical protein